MKTKNVMDVYVGTRRVLCVTQGELGNTQGLTQAMSRPVANFEEALAELDALIAHGQDQQGKKPLKLRIWLSGGLARPFLLNALPKASEAELRRIAVALAPEQTGLASEDGEACEVWVEKRNKANKAGPRVAVAVQSNHLQAILSRFEGGAKPDAGRKETRPKARLLSLRPWWSDVLRVSIETRKEEGQAMQVIAVQDCDALTVLTGKLGKDGQIETAQTLSPVLDQQTAEAALMRSLLAMDVDGAKVWRARLLTEIVRRGEVVDGQVSEAAEATVAMAPFVELMERGA